MAVLWYNGQIYTMLEADHQVEACLTKDGVIIQTGAEKEIREKFAHLIKEEIDLNGKTMLPGFVDSHMHLIGYGESQYRLDLSKSKSKEEILESLEQYAKQFDKDEWIIGEGWNENIWDDKTELLTKEDLDQVVPDQPVILKRVCRHAMVVNSKALSKAGITNATPSPAGGKIERNKNGEVTGFLKDNAMDFINNILPAYDVSLLKKLLKKGIDSCYEIGLTGAHTEDLSYYGSFSNTYQAFKEVIYDGNHPFRAHLLIHHNVIEEWHEAGYEYLSGTPFVQFGPMKIFADGSLGSRTALLSKPYADDPTTNGVAVHSKEDLAGLVKRARELNLPVAVHAIGDLAFEWTLDAIEQYPLKNGRDRLIHAPLVHRSDIERAKNLPVVVDIQPGFMLSDYPWAFERIGPDHQIEYMYAWKSLLEAGLYCAGGSDSPIEPANPLLGIYAAVTRVLPNDPLKKVYQKEERLTVFEAVSLYTKGSAYASLNELNRGLIKENYVADFTILEQNIFEIPHEELLNVKVNMTVVDGKIVYRNN